MTFLTKLGPRVPLVAISPWAKRHYVSHVVHDHTAITRFIETIFDLPALTARDANSDALMDLFDFSCGRESFVPGPAPEAGTGGCPFQSPSPSNPQGNAHE
jgi:phospholipase C